MGNLKTLVGWSASRRSAAVKAEPVDLVIAPARWARGSTMKTLSRWWHGCVLCLGLSLTVLTGCQTWTSGMTLPSGRYLQHPPQYFPESPPYPLPRELAGMEAAAVGLAPGAAALPQAPGPAPVAAPVPAPVPPPAPAPR